VLPYKQLYVTVPDLYLCRPFYYLSNDHHDLVNLAHIMKCTKKLYTPFQPYLISSLQRSDSPWSANILQQRCLSSYSFKLGYDPKISLFLTRSRPLVMFYSIPFLKLYITKRWLKFLLPVIVFSLFQVNFKVRSKLLLCMGADTMSCANSSENIDMILALHVLVFQR